MTNKIAVLLSTTLLLGCSSTDNNDYLKFDTYVEVAKNISEKLLPTKKLSNESDDNSIYSGNIENIEIPEMKMEGSYIDNIEVIPSCNTYSNEDVEHKYSKEVTPYFNLALEISKKVMKSIDCKKQVPINIVNDASYDAYATNEGIFISIGVIDDSQYEDEIVFVIAHEITHYLFKDYENIENSIQEMDKKRTPEAESLMTKLFKFNSSDINQALDLGEKSSVYRDKLHNEINADLLAIDMMVIAGYSPRSVKYAVERMSNCIGYNRGDLNKSFNELNKKADKFNEQSDKSYSDYLSIVNDAVELQGDHQVPPWRKNQLLAYIKQKYPKQIRRQMAAKPKPFN